MDTPESRLAYLDRILREWYGEPDPAPVEHIARVLLIRLRKSEEALEKAYATLDAIHDKAHAHSTGPVVPDVLWEIRNMAG